MLAINISYSVSMMRSELFCSRAGKISSSPADLYGENDDIAQAIFSLDTMDLATTKFSSSVDGVMVQSS